MSRTFIYLILIFYCGPYMLAQHKTSYSQFMFNGMLLNPAYAGSHEALNLTALYRNQWAGFSGAPKSISFSAHSPLKNRKLAAAVLFENESAGLFSHSQAQGALAYRLRLDEYFLSLGIQAGIDTRSFDREALKIRHEDDPSFLQSTMRTNDFVAGGGLYLNGEKFYAGISAPRLTRIGSASHRLVQFHTGGLIGLSSDFILKPSLLIRHIDNSPLFISAAATGYYKDIFGLGTGYTLRSSWFVYFDLRINEQLSFGYAHERAATAIAAYNTGSHEIMFRYLFRYRISAINPRYF